MLSAVALPNLPGPHGVALLPLQQCQQSLSPLLSSVHRTIMMRVHFLGVPYLMMRRRHLDATEPGVYDGRRGVDRPPVTGKRSSLSHPTKTMMSTAYGLEMEGWPVTFRCIVGFTCSFPFHPFPSGVSYVHQS